MIIDMLVLYYKMNTYQVSREEIISLSHPYQSLYSANSEKIEL